MNKLDSDYEVLSEEKMWDTFNTEIKNDTFSPIQTNKDKVNQLMNNLLNLTQLEKQSIKRIINTLDESEQKSLESYKKS